MSSVMSGYYDNFSSSRPSIGDTKISVVSSDHNGWILCDGRDLKIVQFRSLFSVIGYTFGGSGETFKLPDPAGRILGVTGAGDGLTERELGDAVGEETHVLDISEIPQHVHTGTTDASGAHVHGITDPGHVHTQQTIQDDYNGSAGGPPAFTNDSGNTTVTHNNIQSNTTGISVNTGGLHSHTFTSNPTGGTQPHNNMQPTLFMGNMFIYNGVPKFGISAAGGYNWF
jgi:microcystin-dependent protein